MIKYEKEIEETKPKVFCMVRNEDESGFSGTGVVLHGVVFPDGKCVICWKTKKGVDSVSIFDSFDEFYKIHIGQHPDNKTELYWLGIDGIEEHQTDEKKEIKELAKSIGYKPRS